MGFLDKDVAYVIGTSFKFLVSFYRERDGNVRRGEGASSPFLLSCTHVVEISLRPKKTAPAESRLQGSRNNDKT